MLTTLKNAFIIKELRQKLLFTFGMLIVIRFGSQIPAPGINGEVSKHGLNQTQPIPSVFSMRLQVVPSARWLC